MKNNDKTQRLLVLTADIDNDLYKKTKISGPVLGRVQNLNAANQLVLADPEETDANAIFQAVKLYDELKEDGYLVNVATITGSETEGYEADREIARQLELVLKNYKADACIFVTDGASDNRVLPVIESRLKINAVRTVTMKQAEKLENTYFAVLDKLKDPHYARIIFGIPAILLLLFALSYYFGMGWEIPVLLIGVYLAMKGFGIEDIMISSFRGFGFSLDRLSFVFYLSSVIFFIASLFVAYGNYVMFLQLGNSAVAAYTVEGFLLLVPFSLVLYLIGRILDITGRKYLFRGFKYGNYISSSIIFWIIAYSFSAWIIGQVYFSQFMDYTIAAIVLGIAISIATRTLKARAIRSKRLRGMTVINELGALIGKVNKVDSRKGMMQINTGFGNSIAYNIDRIVDISDKVVVR